MSAQDLKTILQRLGVVLGVTGVALFLFVGFILAGTFPAIQNPSNYLFVAPTGIYFIYLAFALRRRFSPGVVHQLISVCVVLVAIPVVFLIMEFGVGGRILRATVALLAFFVAAIAYKSLLRWIGRVAFGKEIVE